MTAMTEAIGLPAGTTAALAAQSSTTPAATVPVWSVVVLLVGLAVVIGWALYVRAVRVDRLHRQVLGSRATLEAQPGRGRSGPGHHPCPGPGLQPAISTGRPRGAGRRGSHRRRRPGPLSAPRRRARQRRCQRRHADHPQSGPHRVRPQPGPAHGGLRVRPPRSHRGPVERARARPTRPGLLPPGPGTQVPQHPCQRGPGITGQTARPSVSSGRARPHAPNLRRRRRHHPRGAAGPRRPGAIEVN